MDDRGLYALLSSVGTVTGVAVFAYKSGDQGISVRRYAHSGIYAVVGRCPNYCLEHWHEQGDWLVRSLERSA